MAIRRTQIARRAALASCVTLAALSAAAFAKDLPPSPDGAQKLQAFFAAYVGKQAPATISPADPGFWVAFDLAALTAPLKASGFAFDPATLKYHVVEQDDGGWRIEVSSFPTMVAHIHAQDGHAQDGGQTLVGTETIAVDGAKGQALIDPAIGFWRSLSGEADSANIEAKFPGIDENVQVGAMKFSGTGQAGADGAVSAAVTETAASANLKFDVDPKAIKAAKAGADAQPYSVNVKTDQVSADVKLDGLRTRPLLDLWAFFVAHPTRPELAANEAAFKTLLAAAFAGQTKAEETASLEKIVADIPQGQVTIDSAKFGASGASGPTGAFGEHFEANGLTLPDTLVPGPFRGFAPTAFAIGFRASGFDVAAASAEMIADLHLAGDGPAIAPDDEAKIRAKLIGADGIVIDIEPSRIVAPLLDISFEGQIVYKGAKPTGKLTIHMRNFDKTQAALKTLGPEVEKKIAPMLAMAKGLAKTDGDGSLVWVGEIGADGVMKVNGLPLGKSPI
jgi:hypothetical protein